MHDKTAGGEPTNESNQQATWDLFFASPGESTRNVGNMTTTNYLDLDINKLFEQHTIKEIEEIQKKIQLESDRKKIELRTLVG